MCSPDSPCALRPSAASGGSRASQSWPDVGPRWPEVRRRGGGGIWAGGYDTDNEAVPACAAAVRRTVVLMACLHRSRALHRSQARMRTRMAQAMRLPCFVTSFLSQSSVQVLVICPAQQPCPSVRRVGRERGGLRRADPGEARRAACRFGRRNVPARFRPLGFSWYFYCVCTNVCMLRRILRRCRSWSRRTTAATCGGARRRGRRSWRCRRAARP